MQFEVFVDSDAFVGLFFDDDVHHFRSFKYFESLRQNDTSLVTTSFVLNEAATVLSHKKGQSSAIHFLNKMEELAFPVLFIDHQLQKKAEQLFLTMTKKGTSMTDCANVAVMRQYEIPTIFSFDKVYEKYHHLTMVG